MPRYGFIREKSEIKYLILYAMTYLPIPVDETALIDICLIDDAFGSLEFAEAFHELVDTGHVLREERETGAVFAITDKGRNAAEVFELQIPFSVRERAQRSALRVVRELRRSAGIVTSTEKLAENNYRVHLSLKDDRDEIISISMMVVNEHQASMLEGNFKRNAEKIYNGILNELLRDYSPDE